MKKQYIQPAQVQMVEEPFALVATSIEINNKPQNDVSGEVKEKGDWDDIWD